MSNLCNLLIEEAMAAWLESHPVIPPASDRPDDPNPKTSQPASATKAKRGKTADKG